ncbi:DMT family transporter [Novosphingobium umbonatum]|uniref:DMT family transporter n=2 Tax=Novosphingobium umbonatum TaxID=1908524 RepID=A0A3S2V5L6_9SPHN|nr:DMT family transporter [Novosphingobium umbonatum]
MPSSSPSSPRLSAQSLASFAIVSLIWGSTWLVIKDQIALSVPAWTVTFRFMLAACGMALLAAVRGESLRLAPRGLALAVVVGLFQFCSNFQFVYAAEAYVPSGLVAVLYALMMVPNAILGRIVLGAPLRGRFLAGCAVAIVGIAVLIGQEYHLHEGVSAAQTLLGVGLTLCGVMSASTANIIQATPTGRAQAVVPMLAWAMLAGAVLDGAFAYATHGAPVIPQGWRFWGGVGWLALGGSVAAFPIYFALIRQIGAGRAAFTNVITPVVAMALSTFFEGYQWTWLSVVGSVVAMAGLVIALTGGR